MIDFKKYWKHSEDEPLSQIVIDGYYGEVGAGSGGYWGFITKPNKTDINPPLNVRLQPELQTWIEDTLQELIEGGKDEKA